MLQDGIVLIFSEGLCVNDWKRRPLRKGIARIGLNAFSQAAISSAFKVIPVSLNYHSFNGISKQLIIHFGEALTKNQLQEGITEGDGIRQFNQLLAGRLSIGMLKPVNDNIEAVQMFISNHRLFKIPRQCLSIFYSKNFI